VVFPKSYDKLVAHSCKLAFVAHPSSKKGYKVFDLDTKEIFVSHDFKFFFEEFQFSLPTIDIPSTPTQFISKPLILWVVWC